MDRDEFVKKVERYSVLGSGDGLSFDDKARGHLKNIYNECRLGELSDDIVSSYCIPLCAQTYFVAFCRHERIVRQEDIDSEEVRICLDNSFRGLRRKFPIPKFI